LLAFCMCAWRSRVFCVSRCRFPDSFLCAALAIAEGFPSSANVAVLPFFECTFLLLRFPLRFFFGILDFPIFHTGVSKTVLFCRNQPYIGPCVSSLFSLFFLLDALLPRIRYSHRANGFLKEPSLSPIPFSLFSWFSPLRGIHLFPLSPDVAISSSRTNCCKQRPFSFVAVSSSFSPYGEEVISF